jgi:hypothetical protein
MDDNIAPVMVSRQVRNRQCRDMGIPAPGYHYSAAEKGDEVQIQNVEPRPFRHERFLARICAVIDHGHYAVVEYERVDTGEHGTVRVFRSGPPDWGTIEFRLIRRVREWPEGQLGPGWRDHLPRPGLESGWQNNRAGVGRTAEIAILQDNGERIDA